MRAVQWRGVVPHRRGYVILLHSHGMWHYDAVWCGCGYIILLCGAGTLMAPALYPTSFWPPYVPKPKSIVYGESGGEWKVVGVVVVFMSSVTGTALAG